jgi:hypothetical protein
MSLVMGVGSGRHFRIEAFNPRARPAGERGAAISVYSSAAR